MKKIAGITFSFLIRSIAVVFLTLLMQNSVKFVKNLYQEKDYRIFKGFSCIFIDPSEDYDGQAADELDRRMITYFHETNSEENSWMFYIGNQLLLYNAGMMDINDLKVTDYAVTINTGYLKANQLRDIDGKLIDIDEDSGIDYLIVPEKYRSSEEEIRDYFIENNTFLRYYFDDKIKYGIARAHEQKHPDNQLEIIYMKNDMTFPSYLPYGQIGNTIKDPVFMVATSSNVSDVQIPAYITSQRYLVKNELVQEAIETAGLEKDIMRVEDVYEAYQKDLCRNIFVVIVQGMGSILMEGIIYLIYKKMLYEKMRYLMISWLLTGAAVTAVYWILSLAFIKAFAVLLIAELLILCKPWRTLPSR